MQGAFEIVFQLKLTVLVRSMHNMTTTHLQGRGSTVT